MTNLELVLQQLVKKVNTAGNDQNLFRLVSVPGHGARVLSLELVPKPEHGVKISSRAPTEEYVQTVARGRRSSLYGASEAKQEEAVKLPTISINI